MFSKFRNDESGFTLIELLVVVLIIGILAAIALPTFLGQQAKGQDSESKSNARNLVSHVESCFADTQDYASCTTTADTSLGSTGLNVVTSAPAPKSDQVQVTTASGGYTVTAASKSGNTFSISKSGSTGLTSRSCTTNNGGTTKGGCKGTSW